MNADTRLKYRCLRHGLTNKNEQYISSMGNRHAGVKEDTSVSSKYELYGILFCNSHHQDLLSLYTDKKNRFFLGRHNNFLEEIIFIERPSPNELIIGVYWKTIHRYAEHRIIKRTNSDGYLWTYPYLDTVMYTTKDTAILHTDAYMLETDNTHFLQETLRDVSDEDLMLMNSFFRTSTV